MAPPVEPVVDCRRGTVAGRAILPAAPDHAFWASHSPPNGWGCSCYVTAARTAAGVRRVGGDPDKLLPPGWNAIDPKTGAPKGIDKGWGYAPGATVSDLIIAQTERLPGLPAQIGAAMFAAAPRSSVDEIMRQFDQFVTDALSSRIERNFMIIGALKPNWISAATTRGVTVSTSEIAVTDLNVQHTFRGTAHVTAVSTKAKAVPPKHDPLDLSWYRGLPKHLLSPKAVILDQSGAEPTMLLIFDLPGRLAKIVIEIDAHVKKAGGALNTIQTGRLVDLADLLSTLGQRAVIIDGAI